MASEKKKLENMPLHPEACLTSVGEVISLTASEVSGVPFVVRQLKDSIYSLHLN
jgi:hypothetical protein